MPQRRIEREKIVLWPSLREAWWIALLPLPPLGFAVWMAVRGQFAVATALAAAFLLLAGLAYALLSRRSTSLELRQDGIEMRVMGRRARVFRWSEIQNFVRVSGRGGEQVGWILRAGAPGQRGETSRELVGADVTLPAYLGGAARKTEALLHAAQKAAAAGTWHAFLEEQRSAKA